MGMKKDIFLSEFYRTNHNKLFLHAYAILKDRSSAEVAVQEAYLIAWRKVDTLMGHENPMGWMKQVVVHTSLHILRDQRRTKAIFIPLEELNPKNQPTINEQSDFSLRERCLQVVSQENFDFFLRIASGQSTYLEEAVHLGISLKACYKRFERIRARLQEALT